MSLQIDFFGVSFSKVMVIKKRRLNDICIKMEQKNSD